MAVEPPIRLLDALNGAARALLEQVDADACGISRIVGEMLVLVTDLAPPGRSVNLGRGCLLPDYPETQQVVRTGRPHTACLGETGIDAAESSTLVDLQFSALLMLRLELDGGPWGLVEIYREGRRPFGQEEARIAGAVLAEFSVAPAAFLPRIQIAAAGG